MTSANFSWGIMAFTLTILTSIGSIVALAAFGYTDPILFAGLVTLGTNALIALSATMNPNRKLQDEVGEVKKVAAEVKAARNELGYQAGEAKQAVDEVKKLLQ